jgi:hypothetical protein
VRLDWGSGRETGKTHGQRSQCSQGYSPAANVRASFFPRRPPPPPQINRQARPHVSISSSLQGVPTVPVVCDAGRSKRVARCSYRVT